MCAHSVWRVWNENICNEGGMRKKRDPEIGWFILEYKIDNLVTSVAAQI